jgi:hypothetical protein
MPGVRGMPTGCERESRYLPCRVMHVDEVDARRDGTHQQFIRFRLGCVDLDASQHFGSGAGG